MNANYRKPVLAHIVFMIFLSFAVAGTKTAFSADYGGRIDLFTQRQPYDGKGPNVQSDAFSPQELVVLYAFVTYNDVPVENLPVAYQVSTPLNASFSLTARTNSSGLAAVSFRILTPPINVSEGEVFGHWLASANVLVDGKTFQDTLTFRVDWIIKLLSIQTIDENLTYRTRFGRGGDVGLKITLRSIAMTLRNATISIVIHDEVNVPVNFSMVEDFAVQPNERLIFLYYKATLEKWAVVGYANVTVSALTVPVNEGGVPYCPSISTEFFVTGDNPLKINYHDVSVVAVLPSAQSIMVGQTINFQIMARDEGTLTENFSVYTYFDNLQLAVSSVSPLQPYSTVIFNFTLNASLLTIGDHEIHASIPPLANEADLTDNNSTQVIEVRPKPNQRHLTIRTIPHNVTQIPGEGWYDKGTLVPLTAPEYIAVSPSMRYRFVYWDIDGIPRSIGAYQIPVQMDSDHTATANYVVQLAVTFRQTGLDPSTSGTIAEVNGLPIKFNDLPYVLWVDNNSIVEYSYYNAVSGGISGKMFRLVNVTGPASPITVSSPETVVGNFSGQYHLSIVSPYGTPSGEGWYDSGTIAYARIEGIHISILNRSRPIFTFWSGDAAGTNYTQSNPILMNGPKIAVTNWKIQCYLIVRTDPRQITLIQGEDWYDQHQNVTLVAPSVEGYNFSHWDVDGVSQNTGLRTIVVYMSDPRIATAHYSLYGAGGLIPDWVFWLFLLLLVLFIILPLAWLYLKRRREKQDAFVSGWTAWYFGYDVQNKNKKTRNGPRNSSRKK